jgi:hypothetical protein
VIEDLLRLVDDPRTVADLRRHDSVHHPRRRLERVGDRVPSRGPPATSWR